MILTLTLLCFPVSAPPLASLSVTGGGRGMCVARVCMRGEFPLLSGVLSPLGLAGCRLSLTVTLL